MPFSLDSIRAIARPFVSKEIGVDQFLERLWPMLAENQTSQELVEPLEVLLAMHAARAISADVLRERIASFAFRPATPANVEIQVTGIRDEPTAKLQPLGSDTSVAVPQNQLVQVA